MSRLVLALVAAAALFVTGAQAQTKIIAGMVAHGPPQWPQYIATELGWFKSDNIEMDFVTAGGSATQQVAGGSLNIAHSGYPDFSKAALQGAGVRIVLNDVIASPYAVFAKPAIKKTADLKGKLMSLGGNNDITVIYIKPYLAAAGLQLTDIDYIYAKAAGDRFAALLSGGVDATMLNPPTYFKALSQGFTNLGDMKPYSEGIPFTVWGANSAWAAQHRDTMVAFARNYRRAVQWLYDPANRQQALDILVKYARQDPKDVADAYDYYVTKLKLFGLDGDVTDESYEKMAEGLAVIGTMKKPFPPKSAIFDGSFVQAASH